MMRKLLLLALFASSVMAAETRPGRMGLLFTCEPARALTVREVEAAGPADRAGLKVGDLIVELNEKTIDYKDALDVFELIGQTVKPDVKTTLTILRDGKRQQLELIAEAMSDAAWERWKSNLAMLRANRARAAQQSE